MLRAAALLILVLPALPAVADEAVLVREDPRRSVRIGTVRFHYENDQALGWLGDTDRWYTAGAGLEVAWQPAWASALACRMPGALRFGPARTGVGLVAGGQLFTPENTSTTAVVNDDRPYAAYAWVGGFWQRSNRCLLDHLQLDLGAVGPSLGAEDLQRTVHASYGYPEPEGWRNQLEDELTVQAYARRKWRFEPTSARDPVRFQAIPHAGIALGTVRRELEGGVLLRAGMNLPDDFGPARLTDAGTATTTDLVSGFSAQAFCHLAGRAVEHDLLLDGNTFRDSQRIDKEPFVGTLGLGVELRYGFRFGTVAFRFSSVWQSDEFQGQPAPHRYTSLTLGCRFRY